MDDLVMSLVEGVLYLVITGWVLGLIFRMIKGKVGSGGGHGGMGVGGHLLVAAVVGAVRLLGQAVRALVVLIFWHITPAIARGLGQLSTRIAARAGQNNDDGSGGSPRRRRALPRVSFEWPSRRQTLSRTQGAYPGDEFSDEWRRAAGDDL